MLIKAIIIIAPLFFCVNSQTFPNQNCPVFRYENQNGNTIGRVELQNDLSGDYRISVNMSVALYLNQNENIKIERQTDAAEIRRGLPIVYFIIFPVQNELLKPTRIEFNGRVYCTGPPATLSSGRGVTNFWATDYLGTGGRIPGATVVPQTPIPYEPTVVIVEQPVTQSVWTPPQVYNTPIVTETTPRVTRPTMPRPTPSVMPSSPNCGIAQGVPFKMPTNSIQLIVGGTDLADEQFPWMAAIMYKIQNKAHQYKCTGSLVSAKHVITAGHCIQYENVQFFPKEDLIVIFAIVDIDGWVQNQDVVSSLVSDMQLHPNYNSSNGDSDIAVLTLEKPVKFTPYVQPVCIWNEGDDLNAVVNQSGIVAGWGSDKTGQQVVSLAAYVEMPIVSQITCLRSNRKFISVTSRKTFCAGKRDGSGPCNGDSGGGFVMKRSGRWTLRGVVSRSLRDTDTCDVMNYIIFADIAKLKPWLDQVLK